MRKLIFIIIPFFIALFSYAQNDFMNIEDCYFFNDTININNYHNYIDSIGTLEFAYSIPAEKYNQLVSCLLAFEPENPKLNFHKATLSESENINDTSFFKYYRKSIESDYMIGESYYNMGVFFINNLLKRKINDSLAIFDFRKKEQEWYFNIAENYIWSSYNSGFKESVFAIGEIQNLKHEYLNAFKPIVNLDQDTLIIITQVLDCGEFGGHIEKIELINNDDIYNAYFYSDSIYCRNEIPRSSNVSKYNGKNVIISEDILIDFISAINSYEDKGGLTNAPVEIAIISNDQILYKRIQNSRWPYYLEFRKRTFDF
jgi:hypothetical protein